MWYTAENVAAVDSPALLIYPDRVRENIRIMKSFVPDVHRLRPHIKTNKSPEAVALMLEAGITKFKCATITEAELLGQAGAPDVLLAYQPTGPKINRLAEVIKRYPSTLFACLVDNAAQANAIGQVMNAAGITLNIWIDLNIGMNRTGILPADAFAVFQEILQIQGIRPVGLHAYDGHIRQTDLAERTTVCDTGFEPVAALARRIRSELGSAISVCAGGTPTFPIHARRADVECSPGTFIYWDTGYGNLLKEQPYLHAAVVLTRVISKPAPGLLCLDLGHKSIAAENPLGNRITFPEGPDFEPIGQSEEHLVVKTKSADDFKIGQPLYGIPYHVCPTVALYDTAWAIRDGQASPDWHQPARKK